MRNFPDLASEIALWKRGFNFVAGADEVGRGAWAGPIVAAACAFAPDLRLTNNDLRIRIDDSKRLTHAQRLVAAEWIYKNALAWGIGEVGPKLINKLGMGRAAKMAFRRAVASCNKRLTEQSIDYLLVDAFYIPYVAGVAKKYQSPVIKGDQKSFSIAAASIIAKVYRDLLMTKLAKMHPEYGWERNKAYGTREHQAALLTHGTTGLHRTVFVETWKNRVLGR